MWSMNLRVQNDLPRTNNDIEGWHNRFAEALQSIAMLFNWRVAKQFSVESSLNGPITSWGSSSGAKTLLNAFKHS